MRLTCKNDICFIEYSVFQFKSISKKVNNLDTVTHIIVNYVKGFCVIKM